MPEPKVTAAQLFEAVRAKFPKAAVLREVTVDDEAAHAVYDAYMARRYPRRAASAGVDTSVTIPADYDPSTAVLVRRIDALMFEGSTQRTAVEIKVSRSDFFRDTAAKRGAWQAITHRFVYVTPAGLVKPEEVPDGCGLWEYTAGQLTVTKRATVNRTPQDMPAAMVRYFAWRAFSAENKLSRLQAGQSARTGRGRRHRR